MSVPGRLLQDVCCDGASGTLARVPGRSERPETGWRVPGQFGRPGTVWEAFRTGEVSRDGAQRPGTVGRPGTPKYPSGVALIRAPGFAVLNGLKHVPGRSGRPGTVAGVPGRLERPGTAGKASRDGCCVLRRWRASWDGANVLGRQAVSQDGENVLGRCVGRPGTRRGAASWDGVERPGIARRAYGRPFSTQRFHDTFHTFHDTLIDDARAHTTHATHYDSLSRSLLSTCAQ